MNHSPWGPPIGKGFSESTRQRGEFSVGYIVLAWLFSYFIATGLAVGVQLLVGSGDLTGDSAPTWAFALAAIALWIPNVAMLVIVSRRRGTGNFNHDFSFRFSRRDLLGIPIGIASQLLLVGIVTWPFRQMFPSAYSNNNIDKRATNLVDAAHGYWIVLLTLIVAIGAPVVEELVFRGFIQGGMQQRFRQTTALLIGAIWFTIVHVNPIEFPGLFAFAIVLGLCFMRTKRLGMSVWAHVAFNATALLLVIIH
ncbi:MAG: CPBP family intramembrane glutamic endopeptidase [Ilumatobacteraceae bacterium]